MAASKAMLIVGRHLEKIIQRIQKINASTKSLVERLCDVKIHAPSELGYTRSISAPDKATLKAEAHALQCTTAGPYNAIPTNILYVGSVCGLGPDLVGIHSISLAARYRTAACSNTLNQGHQKNQAARGYDFAPTSALSSECGLPWLGALRKLSILYVAWTAMADLMILFRARSKRLPQPCSVTNFSCMICWACIPTCFQNPWTHQSLSRCGNLASHEACVACLSSWAYCWFSTHPS